MSQDAATMDIGDDARAIPVVGRWWTVGAALLALAVLLLWLAGYGPGASACRAPLGSASAPAAAAPASAAVIPTAAAATAAVPAPAAAPVVTEPAPGADATVDAPPAPATLPETVTVRFALGKSNAPPDTVAQLEPIVGFLRDNTDTRVALAGFHDSRGSLAKNQQLAMERARAVRELLVSAGIADDRIDLRKPEETTGSGPDDQARRVEVSVER